MKVWKITSCLLAGLISVSCNVKKPKLSLHRAERLAKTYFKPDEFVKIKNNAPIVPESLASMPINERIYYWDSICAYNKLHANIDSGRAYIIDSVAGKPVKYPEFSIEAKNDKRNYEQIINDIQKEVSKYNSKEEMAEIIANEPKAQSTSDLINEITHYYGCMAIQGAEKKGFELGTESQRYRELEKKL